MGLFGDWFGGLDEDVIEKIDTLNKIKLFENCRREDLTEIAEQSSFKEFESGEKVINMGNAGDGMYMVESGQYSVVLEPDEPPLAQFESGNYFGEMALLEGKERSASVVCEDGGELLYLPKKGFFALLREQSKTAGKVLFVLARTLSRRLRKTNQKVREQE